MEHTSITALVLSEAWETKPQPFKPFASLLAEKWIPTTLCWLRCRLSFSLIRSAIQAIRGAQSSRAVFHIISLLLTSSNPNSIYTVTLNEPLNSFIVAFKIYVNHSSVHWTIFHFTHCFKFAVTIVWCTCLIIHFPRETYLNLPCGNFNDRKWPPIWASEKQVITQESKLFSEICKLWTFGVQWRLHW